MELTKLELKNFRQFVDEEINFAHNTEKQVTVIHGSNGSGKTTILKAFTWLFYGKVDFDTGIERLPNEGVLTETPAGEKVEVSVRLEFTHEQTEYVAERKLLVKLDSDHGISNSIEDVALSVHYKQNDSWVERNNPENQLSRILPERLSGLFFFDGEDIDELSDIENQDRIQEAIQNIMGLTILERSSRHLKKVSKRFEKEAKKFASAELNDLITQKEQKDNQLDTLERKLKDKKRATTRTEQEISDIDQTLSRLEDSRALQENRDEYESKIDKIDIDIEEINNNIKKKISQDGFVPLSIPLINETAEELDQMRKNGQIPSELSNSFIDSLLDSGECFCGRPLDKDSDHYKLIESLKGDALADGVEQSALRVIGHLNQVAEIEQNFAKDVDELIEKRKLLSDERSRWEEKLDDVSTELQGLEQTTETGQTIGDLEDERNTKSDKKDQLLTEIGGIKNQIEKVEYEIKDLKEQIEKQEDEKKEALLALRRQKAAEEVRNELDTVFNELKNTVRDWSNKEIKDTFDKIASKEMSARISKDFKLKISQSVGADERRVDKSTGERQIASLAFIGSLVKIARTKYESDSDSEYFTGGIYPIVMDSPFGALDKDHRKKVSRVIPGLASQVVVLATDSQWEGPVEDQMKHLAGRRYWLDFDPGEGEDSFPRTRIVEKKTGGE